MRQKFEQEAFDVTEAFEFRRESFTFIMTSSQSASVGVNRPIKFRRRREVNSPPPSPRECDKTEADLSTADASTSEPRRGKIRHVALPSLSRLLLAPPFEKEFLLKEVRGGIAVGFALEVSRRSLLSPPLALLLFINSYFVFHVLSVLILFCYFFCLSFPSVSSHEFATTNPFK